MHEDRHVHRGTDDREVLSAMAWQGSAGRLRFVRYRLVGRVRHYEIAAVVPTPTLRDTLARASARSGCHELAEALVDQDVTREEALDYIRSLRDRQILVPDVGLRVTGAEPAQQLLELLRTYDSGGEIRGRLERVTAALETLDAGGLGHAPSAYVQIRSAATELDSDAGLARQFQVDLARPAPAATLAREVVEEISHCLGLLERLPTSPHRHATALREFAATFSDRYGEREVPLLDALDDDTGLGYGRAADPSPVLEALRLPNPGAASTSSCSDVDPLILRKLWAALQSGASEIVFEPAELELLGSAEPAPLPDALVAIGMLASSSAEALSRGEFLFVLRSAVRPSGAALFGRFCHLDETLTEDVRGFLRTEAEARPDVLFAEVVHLPQGRTGNVLSRPVLTEYEIPYLGLSGAPNERQLPPADLMVSVSEESRAPLASLWPGGRAAAHDCARFHRRKPGDLPFPGRAPASGDEHAPRLGVGYFELGPVPSARATRPRHPKSSSLSPRQRRASAPARGGRARALCFDAGARTDATSA